MKSIITRLISVLIVLSMLCASLASCSWNEVRETKSMLQKYREYDGSGETYDFDLTEYVLIPGYLGVEIPDINYSPSDEDLENYTALKQAYFSDEEMVDEPAQKYDFVDCSYSAVLYLKNDPTSDQEDAEETSGAAESSDAAADAVDAAESADAASEEADAESAERKGYNYPLFDSSVDNSRTSVMIGTNHFMVPEIDDAMIGMTPGETKTIEFTLPEPYYKDIMSSGLSGVFTVTVKHVRRNILEDFTDDFVVDHYGAASVEAYRDTMVDELVHNMENYYKGYEYDLIENFLASNTIVYKYPVDELNAERDAIYDAYRDSAESAGMELDEYIISRGYSDSADFFDSYVDPQAKLKIMIDMILVFVARCENITISQSEYEDALLKEGAEYDASDISTCEQVVVKKYGSITGFRQEVLNAKVMDFIIENANRIVPSEYYSRLHDGAYDYDEKELDTQNHTLYEKVTSGDGKVSYKIVGEAPDDALTTGEKAAVILLVILGIGVIAVIVFLSIRLVRVRKEQKIRLAEEAALEEKRRIRREEKKAKRKYYSNKNSD